MKKQIVAAAVSSFFLWAATNAAADAQLRLSDGTTTVTVVDEGPGDAAFGEPGVVEYVGPVGTNWYLAIVVGMSSPSLGGPGTPEMDLGTAENSRGAGTLTIDFTQGGFTADGAARLQIGGTSVGTVTYQVWTDPANRPFAKTTLAGTVGPLTPAFSGYPISGETNGTVAQTAPYSMTANVVIRHTAGGHTGFDAGVAITPSCNCAVTFNSPSTITNNAGDAIPEVTASEVCGSGASNNVSVTCLGAVTNGMAPVIITRTNAASDDCGTVYSFVQTICINGVPSVDAGATQILTNLQTTLDGTVTDDGFPADVPLSTTWSEVSGPGTVSFGDSNAPSTTVIFSDTGSYVLRLTTSDSLATNSADVQIMIDAAPVVSAGTNQTITITNGFSLHGIVSDDGLPPGQPLHVAWTAVSGPGMVSIDDPFATNSIAAFSAPGTYVLRLTAGDSLLSSSSDITVVVRPVNHPPVVFAGINQIAGFGNLLQLNGTISDDGQPEGGSLTSRWSMVSGPGTVTFTNSISPTTVATFSAPGMYVLRLSASDSELSSSADVTIIVNQAPTVDAGPDVSTALTNTVTLHGTVADDGLPFNKLTISWTQVSGPGAAIFLTPNSAATDVRFTAYGYYTLRLSATDSNVVSSDDVLVTVSPAGTNMAPFVDAGTNQIVGLTNVATLHGTVVDDGLPFGTPVSALWTLVSGPGTVTLDSATNPITFATFSTAGTYVLQLTADDTRLTNSAQVTISIYPDNQPPVVNAGPDQTIASGPITLSGTVSDDGKPAGALLTTTWSQASGPGIAIFANSNSPVTTVAFSQPGNYTLRFSAADTQFTSSDDVVINVTGNQAPLVDAGADQVLDLAVPVGAATNSTTIYPPVSDTWTYSVGQPGLTGGYGNIGNVWVYLNCLSWSGSALYVGGGFLDAGGTEVRSLARWDGCHFSPLIDPTIGLISGSNSVATSIYPIAARGSNVFISGTFLASDLNHDGQMDFTAEWDGTKWVQWQPNLISSWVSRQAMVATSNAVYFAGQFRFLAATNYDPGSISNAAGTIASFNVAKWDGTNWIALGEGIRGLNSGTNWGDDNTALVRSLAVSANGDVYAGGTFVMQTHSGYATNLAHWDGTNWWPVGPVGFNGDVNALAISPAGDVYAAGTFTQIGDLSASRIARWDGTNWYALEDGLNNTALTLKFYKSDLVVGGVFGTAGSVFVNHVARWTGTTWAAYPNQGINNVVFALESTPQGLYMGGIFYNAGGNTANNIVLWGHDPQPVLEGPDPIVVSNAPAGGTTVPVTVQVTPPCGGAFNVTWNVDGGAAEQTNFLASTTNSGPVAVTFTNNYSPGVHSLVTSLSNGTNSPVVFSTTVTVLTPAVATLNGSVTDDDLPNDTLISQWNEMSGPGSVAFSQPGFTNAQPVTTACFTSAGTYVLELSGNDTEFTRTDDMIVTVRDVGNSNRPPSVSVSADQFVALDETPALQGVVVDDGLPTNQLVMQWTLLSGPGTITFSRPASTNASTMASVSTTVSFSAPGIYTIRLTAGDGEFSSYDDTVVTVSGQTNAAPVVHAGSAQTVALADGAVLQGTVTDDGLPYGVLTSNWSEQSGPGTVLFRTINGITYATFSATGTYDLRLTANDGKLSNSDDVTIAVMASSLGPVVQIFTPADSSIITAPTNVIGTVSSDILQSYTLEYRLKPADVAEDAAPWATLSTGTANVVSNSLAVFDPTMLLNGIYELRLSAVDVTGRSASTDPITVIVDRNLKIGNFALSFSDLSVPVAGVPIEIIRTYDSRDKRTNDFGVGWSIDIRNVRLQKSRNLGPAWYEDTTGGTFPHYFVDPVQGRDLSVTLANGRQFKFTAKFAPESQFGVPIAAGTVIYDPTPDTYAKLESMRGDDVIVSGNVPGPVDLFDVETGGYFNPTLFKLTTEEGETYIIDENEGLLSFSDRNGNTLLVSSNGVIWTNTVTGGASLGVTFVRDPQGRISQIIDPQGNALNYTYGTNGSLSAFTDRETNTTAFAYTNAAFPNYLTGITDPRGVQAIRTEYDPSGRMISQTDGSGNTINFTHDLSNNREIIRDRLGHVTIHEYDEDGNVVRTTDALGNITISKYDALDNLTEQVDALGNTNSYTYDDKGNKLTETDPLGFTTHYTYGPLRTLTSITNPRGFTTTNNYDPDTGALLQETDALGNATGYSYDGNGNLLTRIDALGNVMNNQYDSLGHMTNTTVIDAVRGVLNSTTFTYDTNGNQLSKSVTRTTPAGPEVVTTSYVYDKDNRLLETIHPDGSTNATIYVVGLNKPAVEIDALGRQTLHYYDERGNLTNTVYADGTSESWSYDAENRQVALTDQSGRVTSYSYDALAHMTNTVFADGSSSNILYDAIGRITATSDARGHTTHYAYDPNCGCSGRQAFITNALGQVTHRSYDEDANESSMTDALDRTVTYFYDALDRRTTVLYPDGSFSFTTYDALGRRIAETDQSTNTTWFAYDALSRLIAVTNALGKITTYSYDEIGSLVAQTDANNHTTTFEYDSMGRRTKRTLPLGQIETYQYDQGGQLTNKIDFNGHSTGYAYDPIGRLLSKTPDAFFAAPTVTFSYTPTGQRATMSDAGGATVYQYNSRNWLTNKTWAPAGQSSSLSLNYTYDSNGDLTSIHSSTPGGTAVSYEYDVLNRLDGVNDAHVGCCTEYGYDAVGNLQTQAYPNGINTVYQYDRLNRLTNLTTLNGQAGLIAKYDYTVAPTGHRLTAAELLVATNGVHTINRIYTYDATYRLINEGLSTTSPTSLPVSGSVGYALDDVGNRMSRTTLGFEPGTLDSAAYGYDADDRLTSDAYDANGNTTAGHLRPGTPTVDDQYDFEDHLINRNNGQVTVTYDGDGNRVAKTVGGVTTLFLVDDRNPSGYAQVLEEHIVVPSQPPALVRAYTYGNDLISQDQLLNDGQSGSVWKVSFYGYDGHGSVRYLSDTSGAVTDTYDYDAFGTLIAQSGTTPNNYLYCGEQFDADLGLYYNRARYLNVDSGRFWTEDSNEGNRADPLSLHKYLYANCNPVTIQDPDGHGPLAEAMAAFQIRIKYTVSMIGSAMAAGGQAIGRLWNYLGTLTQNAAQSVMALFPRLGVATQVAIQNRILDFTLRAGDRLAILEAKYKLPSGLGDAMTRLVGQLNASLSVPNAQTVVWTYKEPTLAELNLLSQQLGTSAAQIQFVHGMDGLYRWIEMYFKMQGGG